MTAVIDTLWRSPLKGARGHRQRYLSIDPIVGVQDDRQYGIRRRAGDMTQWAPKAAFYVCMNTAQMAVEKPIFVEGGIEGQYLDGLAERIGAKSGFDVQHADHKYSLHDTKGAYVSFINLASVQAFSEFMGVEIDPRRFRMNVWMTGLEPFEELTWVDAFPGTREIIVGDCHFRVDDACERCKATEANPSTGQYDLQVLKGLQAFMSSSGYKSPHRGTPIVMGILAAPLDEGLIKKGDEIRLA